MAKSRDEQRLLRDPGARRRGRIQAIVGLILFAVGVVGLIAGLTAFNAFVIFGAALLGGGVSAWRHALVLDEGGVEARGGRWRGRFEWGQIEAFEHVKAGWWNRNFSADRLLMARLESGTVIHVLAYPLRAEAADELVHQLNAELARRR